MTELKLILTTLSQPVHANKALNLLIELDNRSGLKGLRLLEQDLTEHHTRLATAGHPAASRLARWLRALAAYCETYYPPHRPFIHTLYRAVPGAKKFLPSIPAHRP